MEVFKSRVSISIRCYSTPIPPCVYTASSCYHPRCRLAPPDHLQDRSLDLGSRCGCFEPSGASSTAGFLRQAAILRQPRLSALVSRPCFRMTPRPRPASHTHICLLRRVGPRPTCSLIRFRLFLDASTPPAVE